MSKIHFYTDEHVSKAVARGFRRRGVDVLTTPEADMLSARDEEHLMRAREEGRVIFNRTKISFTLPLKWATPESSIPSKPPQRARSSPG